MRKSTMAVAPPGWEAQNSASMPMPDGLFGRRVIITCGAASIDSDALDVEFTVPFDDQAEPNEARIVIYNLTKNTISQFKYNDTISIVAGYGEDTGEIFRGRVSSSVTDRDGIDKRTTLTAIDDVSLDNREVVSLAFRAGTQASFILRTLVERLGLPVAVFKTTRDETYTYEMNVEGSLSANIRKYADMCGTQVYILGGKAYVRDSRDSEAGLFRLSAGSGMIGSPEAFEETVQRDGYQEETVMGYKVSMLLQHRIRVASLVEIDSLIAQGQYRVRSGQHSYEGNDFITEIEAV